MPIWNISGESIAKGPHGFASFDSRHCAPTNFLLFFCPSCVHTLLFTSESIYDQTVWVGLSRDPQGISPPWIQFSVSGWFKRVLESALFQFITFRKLDCTSSLFNTLEHSGSMWSCSRPIYSRFGWLGDNTPKWKWCFHGRSRFHFFFIELRYSTMLKYQKEECHIRRHPFFNFHTCFPATSNLVDRHWGNS